MAARVIFLRTFVAAGICLLTGAAIAAKPAVIAGPKPSPSEPPKPSENVTSTTLSALENAPTSPTSESESASGPRWEQVFAPNTPPPRFRSKAVYKPDRQILVLLGGYLETKTYCNETWEYNGHEWSHIPIAGPPANGSFSLAYDQYRGMVVFVGGDRETWEYDSKTWRRADLPEAPPITGFGAMAYDLNRRICLLYGGETEPAPGKVLPALTDQTWRYDGFEWARVDVPGPPARKYHQMVYDAARKRFVMFGGFNGRLLNDTWEFRETGWHKVNTRDAPKPRRDFSLTYDPTGKRTLLFGGHPGGDELWAFNGTNWTRLGPGNSPPAREGAVLAYIPTTHKVLLFSGLSNRLLNDMWVFSGGPVAPDFIVPPLEPGAPETSVSDIAPPLLITKVPIPSPNQLTTSTVEPAPTPATGPAVSTTPTLVTSPTMAVLPEPAAPSTRPITIVPAEPPKPPAEPIPTPSAEPLLADMQIGNATMTPTRLKPTTVLSFTGKVRNAGKSAGRCWVEFWLSPQKEPFQSRHMLCRSQSVELKPGDVFDLSEVTRMPYEGIPAGDYYLMIQVDRPNEVTELDETNNQFILDGTFTVVEE